MASLFSLNHSSLPASPFWRIISFKVDEEVNDDELEIPSFTDDDRSFLILNEPLPLLLSKLIKIRCLKNKDVANKKGKHQENAQQSARDPVVETIASRVASSDERI